MQRAEPRADATRRNDWLRRARQAVVLRNASDAPAIGAIGGFAMRLKPVVSKRGCEKGRQFNVYLQLAAVVCL